MHLNLSDTSPLKVFASSLRSKLRACTAYQPLAELTLMNTEDRCLQLAVQAPGMHDHALYAQACNANTLSCNSRSHSDGKKERPLPSHNRFSNNR